MAIIMHFGRRFRSIIDFPGQSVFHQDNAPGHTSIIAISRFNPLPLTRIGVNDLTSIYAKVNIIFCWVYLTTVTIHSKKSCSKIVLLVQLL